jgi:sigma-E factor negative regulatory protein RseA
MVRTKEEGGDHVNADISALVDGELEDGAAQGPLHALGRQDEARDTWRRYHLIGDAMRGTPSLSPGFQARLSARLASEPTVLVPVRHAWRPQRSHWMAMAAGLAGVAFVGGVFFQSLQQPAQAPLAKSDPAPVTDTAAQVAPPEAANDYLLAHQGYSPRTSLQGVAPYVRVVAEGRR